MDCQLDWPGIGSPGPVLFPNPESLAILASRYVSFHTAWILSLA